MTITTTNSKKVYTANGATTVFGWDFFVPDASSLVVQTIAADGTTTTVTTGITVTGYGTAAGAVTFTTAPANGLTVVLSRNVAQTQGTDLTNQDGFYPEVLEAAFDKLTMLVQQNSEQIGRAIKSNIADTGSAVLPIASARANKTLAFDASGNPIPGPTATDIANAQTNASAAAASASAASGSASAASGSAGAAAGSASAAAGSASAAAGSASAAAGSASAAAASATTAGAGSITGRNRLINGDFRISQRNGTTAVTPTTATARVYVFDRWFAYHSQASKLTYQQGATLGAVFKKTAFCGVISVASAYTPSTGEVFTFSQSVEGLNMHDLAWGTADAQPITLSFRVRSSLTGNFSGAIRNSSASRAYPFSFTINTANTEQTISITIPGDTGSFWPTTPDVNEGFTLAFDMGSSSTMRAAAGAWASGNYVGASSAQSLIATAGATFQLTDVQLEAGSAASAFERRSYGQELALCQRYFFLCPRHYMRATGTSAGAGNFTIPGMLPVPMRVSPTVIAGTNSFANGGSAGNPISCGSAYEIDWNFNITGAGVDGQVTFANYQFNAEL